MSQTIIAKVSEIHDALAHAMDPLRGSELTQAEIRNAFAQAHPDGGGEWVIAADHCRDHSNKGSCQCSQTENAIFERLGRNRYRVL